MGSFLGGAVGVVGGGDFGCLGGRVGGGSSDAVLAQLSAQQSGAAWAERLALLDPVLSERAIVNQGMLAQLGHHGVRGCCGYAGAPQAAADFLFAAWPLRQKAQRHVDRRNLGHHGS